MTDAARSRRRGTAARRPVIGMVGTFDVANFGDLLFPEIAKAELERRLGPVDLRRYAPRRMASPPWPYAVGSIDDLVGSLGEMDLLIVGGGHLVRFDHKVAPGYGATASAVPHPSGYWLSPTLAAVANGVPVAWNGLGASAETPPWARPLLAGAMRAVDHVGVRDRASLEGLAEVAPGVKIDLVPDSAFGIASLLAGDPASLPAELQGSPYVIVQASAGLRPIGDATPDRGRACPRGRPPGARAAGLAGARGSRRDPRPARRRRHARALAVTARPCPHHRRRAGRGGQACT